MIRRVVAQYLTAKGQGKAKTDEIPVRNRDTGRIVWVVKDTIKEHPDRFQTVSPDDLKPPAHQHKPDPPQKPARPRKPHHKHDPIPVPQPYLKPPVPVKPVKTVKPVKPVPPVKILEPPRPVKHPLVPGRKQYRKLALVVAERFEIESSNVSTGVWIVD